MPAIGRILVPLDFSASSRAALEYAAFLAEKVGAALTVLHVAEPAGYVGPDTLAFLPASAVPGRTPERGDVVREAEELLSGFAERPGRIDVRVVDGEPSDAILRAARDAGADLVVMGTHGRTGLSRLLVGSVAEAVMRRSICPVLTIRVPAKAPREMASP